MSFNRRDKERSTILSGLLGVLVRRSWRSWRYSRVHALLEEGQTALSRGECDTARRACNAALTNDPANVMGHYLLGSVDAQAGLYETATQHLERCVTLGATFPEAYIHLGNVYRLTGDFGRARQSYRKAVDIDPCSPLGHYSLALILQRQGAAEEALIHLGYAQAASQLRGEVIRLRAKTFVELGRYDEAAAMARTAVEEHPSCYDSWVALGYAYQKLHQPHDALHCYDRALTMRSGDAELFNNYGIVLQDVGRVPEAITSYDAALQVNSEDALARFHKALANLLIGKYEAGWPDYEARLVSADHPARRRRHRRWQGEDLKTKQIVAYGEQGLGDEIMFASCLPDLIRASRHCFIDCSPKLHKLFSRSFPHATVYVSAPDRTPPEQIEQLSVDVEVPFGSLPLHYRRSRTTFPNHTGYLRADPARIAAWQAKVNNLGSGLKVGVSWKGGTYKTRNPVRSVGIEQLLPIFRTPNTQFVSLQYTADASAQIEVVAKRHGIAIAHWQDAIDDYDETAALVSALDVIVTVCTSIVHLAGALGRQVWIIAPYVPEWRYGLQGKTMDWYPSARLFRQSAYGCWEDVIKRVAGELGTLVNSGGSTC